MNNENNMPSIDTLITPEVREQILANKEQFIGQLNDALQPWGVTYQFGKSVSFCVKQSDKYVKLDKRDQTVFMNKIKSILKAHKVGERLTLEAIARGFWAQFNGTNVDSKTGALKKLNVSFVRSDIKASREDDNIEGDLERAAAKVKIARLEARVRELEVVSVTPVVTE
jgi:hypothetical protein